MPDTGRSVEEILRDATQKVEALIVSNGVLSETVQTLAATVGTLQGQRKRDHKIYAAMALIMMVAIAGVFWTNHKFSAARTARLANCQSANEQAQKQKQLWNGILALSARDQQPEESDPTTLAEFNQLLNDTFTLRICK